MREQPPRLESCLELITDCTAWSAVAGTHAFLPFALPYAKGEPTEERQYSIDKCDLAMAVFRIAELARKYEYDFIEIAMLTSVDRHTKTLQLVQVQSVVASRRLRNL